MQRFQSHELTADWTFVRFHYGSRGRRGNYSERELEEWARRIDDWRGEVDVLRVLQQRLGGLRRPERALAEAAVVPVPFEQQAVYTDITWP